MTNIFGIFAVFACLMAVPHAKAEQKKTKVQYFQTLTGQDPEDLGNRWDALYQQNKETYIYGRDPAPFLVEVAPMLPKGKVLDIAMAEGRNAVFMAKRGYDVVGVDISEEAIRKARRLAAENRVRVKAVIADLSHYQIPKDSYDVILSIYYLDRNLIKGIKEGLKKGGVVVFENQTTENLKYNKSMPKEWLLEPGELKALFKDFTILRYRETDTGKEAIASLVARKP